jgi:hypothetical protein
LNNSVKKLDKHTYEVEYVVGGKIYRMIVIPKRGPPHIIQATDQDGRDITDNLLPYYGPNYDWHSIHFIPQFFNCDRITFILSDGSEKTFEEHNYILL